MKIVMFTPIVPQSAIGRATRLMIAALKALGHDVSVVRTETERYLDTPGHASVGESIPWVDEGRVASTIAESDIAIYQIGNNFDFHKGAIEWLTRAPGIVCLHDFFLGHLFYAWAESRPQEAYDIVGRWYGTLAADAYFSYSDGDAFISGTHETAPMTEWICRMALGVVVHSEWGTPRVLESCGGPVRVLPLPYDAPGLSAPSARRGAGVRRASPKVRILTIGHINTNKRVASVIHAIGSEARLRDSVHYQLVGQIEDSTAAELTDLARDTGVDLTISGVVSDEDLTVALEGADVICSLRWPTLESASASAIESMLWGKPTVVTGSGFCSEIPDECVAKVDPLSETSDLVRILLDLATDPKLRKQLGARASAWAKTTFSADRYAAGLEEMAKSVLRIAPAAHALTGLAEILENWQLSLSDDITERIVGPLRLFEHDFSKSRDVRR